MLEPDQDARIVVVGIGTVGSAVVDELSRCGVTDFVLIDGDTLDTVNVIRHVLGPEDVGHNKAEAMAARLVSRYAAHAEFVPENLTETISDAAVDRVFAGADVIVAATDDRVAQRRVNRRALALVDCLATLVGMRVARTEPG